MRPESISINPADGTLLGVYPAQSDAQIAQVLADAELAYGVWGRLSKADRSAAMARLGIVLGERRAALANLITAEMGKPITEALAEVDKCANLCRWYAENLENLLCDEHPDVGADGKAIVSYLPLGIVLGVMPWNFPLWQVLRAAVPVMSAGNCFVLKHADNVQGSANALATCFQTAGFPHGALSVINSDRRTTAALLADDRIVGVSVTAGVAAGSALAAEAGRNLKKSVLELGGSDPFIVLADADLDRAVATAVKARFQNCGQVCISAKRIIVEKPVAEEFTRRFVEVASRLTVGDPLKPETAIGPMARERLRAELHALVERSVDVGARILLGGRMPEGPGSYYLPTVLDRVTNEMPVCREETFGPVASILVADNADHAVELANESEFGLSGALWSSDIDRASELALRIESGAVFINGLSASDPRVPIGGIKNSGYGRELSHFGLREFCNVQLRWVRSSRS